LTIRLDEIIVSFRFTISIDLSLFLPGLVPLIVRTILPSTTPV